MTPFNNSIVDYCITSLELLKLLFDFDILESSKLFSDVHAPLHILLSVSLNNNDSNTNTNTVRKTNYSKAKIKSWENEKVTDIQENRWRKIKYFRTETFTLAKGNWCHRSSDNRLIVRVRVRTLAISSQVLPGKRLEHLIVKTLIVKLTRIKMVEIKNLGLTKTVNLLDKNIENLRDVIS